MKLLVATTATQGDHPGDFDWCTPGKLVEFAMVLDHDLLGDPLGVCGCDRAFDGMTTGKGTTTAMIADVTMSRAEYVAAVRASFERQRRDTLPAAREARLLMRIADAYPVGTVIGHRLRTVYIRSTAGAVVAP